MNRLPLPHKLFIGVVMVLIFLWVIKLSEGAEPAPPPWCVRVNVKDGYGSSHGSGSLVSPSVVLTNNHVVRDRKSDDSVTILFPNGDEVPGKVIKTDKVLDIAAIRIESSLRPYVTLREKNLEMGERLTIHGYGGSGVHRSGSGVITSWCGPTSTWMAYLTITGTNARDGDSGGPLVCDNGELGGVLFGSSGNTTSGIRIREVRKFVDSLK